MTKFLCEEERDSIHRRMGTNTDIDIFIKLNK